MANKQCSILVDGVGDNNGFSPVKVDLPGNSNKSKTVSPKKIEKVVTSGVKVRKKSTGRKLAELFDVADIKQVASYIVKDVIIPSTKTLLTDMVFSSWNMLIYKDPKGTAPKRTSPFGHFDYSGCYRQSSRNQTPAYSSGLERKEFDEFVFDSKRDAEEVLTNLINLIDNYQMASLQDFYTMLDMPTRSTDNNWGWKNLSSACVKRVSAGYFLDLPKAIPLD